MARLAIVLVIALTACSSHPAATGDGGGGTDGNPASTIDAAPPMASCAIPAGGALVDTSAATNVIGDGSPGSCTEAAVQAQVTKGGLVRFNCGSAPLTITLTSALVINNVAGSDMLGDTVIDGGGTITLSGGGSNRIISLDACAMPYNSPHCDTFPHPALTVERLGFVDGYDGSTEGGGAIYRNGGALTVIDSTFQRNTCATTGQDTAGGALRLIYATPTLIVGSTFGGGSGNGNKCSNGGAIGSLNAEPITIVNSTIDSNIATGSGGNPGNGGNGGGTYHDGDNLDVELCGVQITNNTANAYGGGIFYVSDDGNGKVDMANTEIANNTIAPSIGNGGGGYLQGAVITLTNMTLADNNADFAPGLFVNTMSGKGSFDATNLTVSGMTSGDGLTLQGNVAGTLLNTTIANNKRGLSGAANMTLTNTLVSGNSSASCDAAAKGGTGSFQFPGTTCGAATMTADPQLGTLQDNAGSVQIGTMAPAASSPAISAGSGCPPVDARGMARPASGCTSGAYQAP